MLVQNILHGICIISAVGLLCVLGPPVSSLDSHLRAVSLIRSTLSSYQSLGVEVITCFINCRDSKVIGSDLMGQQGLRTEVSYSVNVATQQGIVGMALFSLYGGFGKDLKGALVASQWSKDPVKRHNGRLEQGGTIDI